MKPGITVDPFRSIILECSNIVTSSAEGSAVSHIPTIRSPLIPRDFASLLSVSKVRTIPFVIKRSTSTMLFLSLRCIIKYHLFLRSSFHQDLFCHALYRNKLRSEEHTSELQS